MHCLSDCFLRPLDMHGMQFEELFVQTPQKCQYEVFQNN